MNTATWRTRQNTAGLATPSPSREATVRCSRTVSIFRSRANDRVSDPLGASRLPGVCPRSCSGTRASVSDEGTQRSRRPRVAEEVVEGDRERKREGERERETNIARTHAHRVPRSLGPAAGEAGLSRPRHSVRDTIRCNLFRVGLGIVTSSVPVGGEDRCALVRIVHPRGRCFADRHRGTKYIFFFFISNSNESRAKGQSERAASRSCDRSSNRRTRDRKDRTRSRSHGERDSRLLRTTIPASWRTRGRRRERNPRCARGTSITEELPLRGYVCGIERTGTRPKSGKKKTLHQPRRYSFVAAPFAGIGPRGST